MLTRTAPPGATRTPSPAASEGAQRGLGSVCACPPPRPGSEFAPVGARLGGGRTRSICCWQHPGEKPEQG